MRTQVSSYTASPVSNRRQVNNSTNSKSQNEKEAKSTTPMENVRMFDLFETKAKVEILNSAAEDRLAASMYGGLKKTKRKNSSKNKQRKGVSGYNFDRVIKDESSSSSNSDFHDSFGKYS